MKTVYLILTLACLSIFISCEESLIGPDYSNDPVNVFEQFWNEMDKYYPLFGVKKVDWKASYNYYRPLINSGTSEKQLWNIFDSLVQPLYDGHVRLYSDEGVIRSGGFNCLTNFSRSVVKNNYLNNEFFYAWNKNIFYGKIINSNVGYIYIDEFSGYENWQRELINAFKYINNYNKIIIDLRENRGGWSDVMLFFLSAFFNEPTSIFLGRTRNGPGYNDFHTPITYIANPLKEVKLLNKHIAIITNCWTASASNNVCWVLKDFNENTIQVGERTANSFSIVMPEHILPNGWIYSYSGEMITKMNGEALDSSNGLVPDYTVINKWEDIVNGYDEALFKAFVYLNQK